MTESSKSCPQCGDELPAGSASTLCAKCLLQVGFETQENPEQSASSYAPTFIAPTAEELAPHFPQLDILEQIGHGGMGVVYKARQKELDRIVALKIIRPGIAEDRNFEERFQREARALAKLNHANIITVYDFGRKDGLFFFIMEYVDGTNLRHLERSGELNPQDALSIVPQICIALQYAHDNGIVHRDIKPENILINKEGEVRIADFGLAKLAGVKDDAPLTGTWQVMGTPHYMAPEQFEKPTTVDHRADIYSLGVVIYELLTGELPLGRFPVPSSKAQVDVRLDEVVLRALDKEPGRRYQHVTDVATAVESAQTPDNKDSPTSPAVSWLQEKAGVLGKHVTKLKEKSADWKAPAVAADAVTRGAKRAVEVVAPFAALLKKNAIVLWQQLTFRRCVLTALGIIGWCAICIGLGAGGHELMHFSNVPTKYVALDNSAHNAVPILDLHPPINISSSDTGESNGFDFERIELERNRIMLKVGRSHVATTLNFDFETGEGLVSNRQGEINRLPIGREVFEIWLIAGGIDVAPPSIHAEIEHLLEVVQLMQRTKGLRSRLSLDDRELFPTLNRQVTSLIEQQKYTAWKLIPVGRLLDPDLFECTSEDQPFYSVQIQPWVELCYTSGAVLIWLIGLLRVCRVLYVHLWNSTRQTDDEWRQAQVNARWRRCCGMLIVTGTLTAIIAALCAATVSRWNPHIGLFRETTIDIPEGVHRTFLMAFVALGFLIALSGLLARPTLKKYGWRTGLAGGTLAMLALPLSLITFPTGLAALVLLTKSDVRREFGYEESAIQRQPQVEADAAPTAS